jgi:tetratricopeptide (TPR) repeat protein
MRFLLPILLITATLACKNKQSPERRAAEEQILIYESNPNDSTALNMVKALGTYIDAVGFKDSTTANYILRAARTSAKHNMDNQALGFYKLYMIQYPTRPDQANIMVEVIDIMTKIQKPELNQILYRSFVERFNNDPRAAQYDALIANKEIRVDSFLKGIGLQMFNDSIYRLDENMARLYVDASEAAVMSNPDLPEAAEYLHRAAETARTLRDIPKAITLYDWIIDQYPNHPRGATALFLKAFTFDNDLKDYENARKYYDEFLAKHPNNEFAESAKFLLDNLGKSDEELRQIIEQKQKENQDVQ